MTIEKLAAQINAQLCPGAREPSAEVAGIYTACTMSSLIANASRDTLLVTSLNNSQLIRVAELMDAPGLCLAGAVQPVPELLALARRSGIAIIVSPWSLEETRGRLEACLVRGAARA
jgi:serine kinase of HPr protein (carbohydrate metabolism regulator)